MRNLVNSEYVTPSLRFHVVKYFVVALSLPVLSRFVTDRIQIISMVFKTNILLIYSGNVPNIGFEGYDNESVTSYCLFFVLSLLKFLI